MNEDIDGIANTEKKWHVISARMREIENFNKTWYGVKMKWNRWGRKYFGIEERVRRRTDSMTTGVRNKPAPKIKASERAATVEASPEAPYQSCTCGAPDAAVDGMIACEGTHELSSWFHYECVGLTADTLPAGRWFCTECMEADLRNDDDEVEYQEGDGEEEYPEDDEAEYEEGGKAEYQEADGAEHEEGNGEEYQAADEEHQNADTEEYEEGNREEHQEADGDQYEEANGDEYEEFDEEELEDLPPSLPDHAPKPKRKRDEDDDEYSPDATHVSSDTIRSKRIRV
ncbi:retrotransposon-like protein 1 [Xylographa opegraphella]|nr:retrotransposon-like protein 1 [Xylographa opegraphella]